MINQGFRKDQFEIFYLSKEIISNPLISKIIDYFKYLRKEDILKKQDKGIISIGFGKRILINGETYEYSNIRKEELIEVADYDPIKNNLLIIGKNKPLMETPLHWMIHHARTDVNCIVQINNKKLINKKYPSTEKDFKITTIEIIKEVMKKLKDSKIVILKNHGILFVGNSIKEVDDLIKKVKD